MRRTIKCANASCHYHHRVHLSKAHNFQTFTTVLSAPTEMSYNQIQLQAIVSEPNSKATSFQTTNIIHLPLFVQCAYLGSETQSRTLCGSVRLQCNFQPSTRHLDWHLNTQKNNNPPQLVPFFPSLFAFSVFGFFST